MARASARRSRSEWQHLVEQQRRGEVPELEFCRREELNLGTFRWWKSQLRGAVALKQRDASAVGAPPFSAVTLREAAAPSAGPGAVEILLQGDERRLRISFDCPVELAVAITAVLRDSGSCS